MYPGTTEFNPLPPPDALRFWTKIKELEDQLKVIDYKCKYYEEAIAAGTEDIHKHKTGHCCDDEKENKDA